MSQRPSHLQFQQAAARPNPRPSQSLPAPRGISPSVLRVVGDWLSSGRSPTCLDFIRERRALTAASSQLLAARCRSKRGTRGAPVPIQSRRAIRPACRAAGAGVSLFPSAPAIQFKSKSSGPGKAADAVGRCGEPPMLTDCSSNQSRCGSIPRRNVVRFLWGYPQNEWRLSQ